MRNEPHCVRAFNRWLRAPLRGIQTSDFLPRRSENVRNCWLSSSVLCVLAHKLSLITREVLWDPRNYQERVSFRKYLIRHATWSLHLPLALARSCPVRVSRTCGNLQTAPTAGLHTGFHRVLSFALGLVVALNPVAC